jgi:hypothetical protein
MVLVPEWQHAYAREEKNTRNAISLTSLTTLTGPDLERTAKVADLLGFRRNGEVSDARLSPPRATHGRDRRVANLASLNLGVAGSFSGYSHGPRNAI